MSWFLGLRQLVIQKINIRYLAYLSPKIRFIVNTIFWTKTEKKWRFFFNRSYLRPNSKLRDSTISHYFVWVGWIYLFLISLFLHLISFFIQEQFFEAWGLWAHTKSFWQKQFAHESKKIWGTIWNFLHYISDLIQIYFL